MQERIAAAEGGQALTTATLHALSRSRSEPAPADKLQEQLEAAQMAVYEADMYDDSCL